MQDFDNNLHNADISFINQLNEGQKEAVVTVDTPLLVLAGAGTGKTRVITYKIAYAILKGLAMPYNILAVTFTNKAAHEMKERISSIIPEDYMDVNIGTFHSVFLKILRKNHDRIAIDKNFLILDSSDQKEIIRKIMKDDGICTKTFQPKNVLSAISKIKEAAVLNGGVVNYEQLYSESLRAINIYKLYTQYEQRLKELNTLDFDDLLLKALTLFLNHQDVLEYYRNRFKFILVDEYQDTNEIQYRLIRLLAGQSKNICLVGDDDQSIYSWRGAKVENILKFTKDFKDSKVIKLEENYRSSNNILVAADAVISNNESRFGKVLRSTKGSGSKVTVSQFFDERSEVNKIIEEIESIKKTHGHSYNDFAVLIRSNSNSRYLEECFIARSLPYKIVGGLKFYERKEVKDILSYLRILANDNDYISFRRAVLFPKRGIGETTIDKIEEYARKTSKGIEDTLCNISGHDVFSDSSQYIKLSEKFRKTFQEFFVMLKNWKVMFASSPEDLEPLVLKIMDDINYENNLKEECDDENEFENRTDNIKELIRLLSNFKSLEEFLEYTSLVSEEEDQEFKEQVSIMTIHASKGLEFKNIFLPFWEEGVFPNQRAIDENGTKGIEEERRLAYVAITRAMVNLFISYAKTRFMSGSVIPTLKSRFVEEIECCKGDFFEIKDYSSFGPKTSYNGYKGFDKDISEYKKRSSNYDNFYKSSNSVYKKTSAGSKGFLVGSKVTNQKFGLGIIIKVDGVFCDVVFDNGEKKTIRNDFLKM